MYTNSINSFLSHINKLSCNALEVCISSAKEYGVNIYLIGGIVRDLLLEKELKDIDITVEGNAIEFAKFLESKKNCKIIAVQENLKTAKVRIHGCIDIDFASTREEKYLSPGVMPEAYNFGCDLSKDVKRRDFTINTLAIKLNEPGEYNIIDYFGGLQDLNDCKIRILHPKSFSDDPSRIIRAIKFKKRLDFEYETNTYTLMQNYLKQINQSIPLERIKHELCSYFSMNKNNLYKELINTNAYKLITDNPVIKIEESNICKIKKYISLSKKEQWFIYIIFLLVNCSSIPQRLNLDSKQKKIIQGTKEMLEAEKPSDNFEIYKLFKDKNNLSLFAYYVLTTDDNLIKFIEELKDIQVLTTGHDLIALGLKPSEYFNKIFDKILKEKIFNGIKTKNEELEFVKSLL